MLGFLSVTSGWVGPAFSCCVVSPTSKLELWFDLLVLPFLSSLKECGSEKELIVPCSFVCFDFFFSPGIVSARTFWLIEEKAQM